MRKTKIICTLGPASDSEEMIEKLILTGMNAARFNFSHGTHESHLAVLTRVKNVRDRLGCPVATILDTKGPEIRIRSFANGKIHPDHPRGGRRQHHRVRDLPQPAQRGVRGHPPAH